MEWFEKFKVGQNVRVVKKVLIWKLPNGGGCSWNDDMDITVGKVYKILEIIKETGYKLLTENNTYNNWNYWYPAESLACVNVKGKQLLFDFME